MQIEQRTVDGVVIFDLKGKFTELEDEDQFTREVDARINAGCKKLLLNLAECPYVNSVGMGAVVRGYSRLGRQRGEIKLLNVPQRVIDLLEITKLFTIFDKFEDEAEAVASFAARKSA